jgi:anti-anti-sigma regulatory factor
MAISVSSPPRDFEAITLRPAGELDIATAADAFGLGQIVGSAQRVILDSEVTLIGAAALGAVVRLRNLALGSGGDVELISLPPKIERVFVLGGLQVLLAARRSGRR